MKPYPSRKDSKQKQGGSGRSRLVTVFSGTFLPKLIRSSSYSNRVKADGTRKTVQPKQDIESEKD
jgi:hypothetical protein